MVVKNRGEVKEIYRATGASHSSVAYNQKMRCTCAVALLLTSIVSASDDAPKAPATGSICGVVRFVGEVPPAKKIFATDGTIILHRDLIVAPKNKGLRHVAVMLDDAQPQAKLKDAKAVLVDQRDMLFSPRVVAVQHGQKVRFENNDLGNHSVMATSLLPANQLNVVAAPGQPVEHAFEPQKTPVMIGCALHPWMRAWVYVAPHPWFAVTDSNGVFRINRVPPGKHTLILRHADTNRSEQRMVEVKPGVATTLEIVWK